jgi:peptide/nickel transport system substrate-binding protein
MIRKIAIIASAMSCLTLGVISANGASAATAKAHVLTEEGNVGVTFTQNFNPFNSNSLAAQMSIKSLTYEPLVEIDYLKANTEYPWLATSYKWTNGGRTITFTIRTGVKWSDGTPFTPADVAYTFNLIGQNPAANYSGVPQMTNAATVKGDTVSLNFASPAYQAITAIAGSTLIVPEHVWSRITNPAKAVITNPIGTGPYVLKSYSSQLVSYKVNPNYWGGKPAATQVNIPSYSSNASATTALANGQLDWAGNDIANINAVFVNKNPKTNHYYFAGGNTVTLTFNVNYGALSDPVVRGAISAGINRTELGIKGESGYELPATSSSGLILPNQGAFLSAKAKNDLSPTSNAAKVASLLYGADWNVYSTAHFTGWVTAANPYMDPSPSDPELPVILMHLKLTK